MSGRAPWSANQLQAVFATTSTALLLARLYASRVVGFGDAEALYATYVAHPAAAYVDHPGLVAVLGALAGRGAPPSPEAAHALTAVLASLVPLAGWGAALLAGAPPRRAAQAGLVVALCPALAIGLFGLTPDLPFAALSLLTIGGVCFAIRADAGDFRGDVALLAAGACAGLATLAKLPGLALVAWVPLATWHRRPRWLVVAAAALALMLMSPVVAQELRSGLPMMRHRFVHTQEAAGFSLRNVAALVGGQLLYMSPFVVAAAWATGRAALRTSCREPVGTALGALAVCFGVPLGLLCLWSRVAEPHWFAPTYLPLLLVWARRPSRTTFTLRLRRPMLPVCAALVVIVHAYVLTDLFPRFAGRGYDGRYDLANDMRMFPAASETLNQALLVARLRGPTVTVVAPHWTLASQLAVVLPPGTRVTTAGRLAADDDFGRWVPREERDASAVIFFVTDDRFGDSAALGFTTGRHLENTTQFPLRRGGRVVRVLQIQTYSAARALADMHAPRTAR